MKQSSNKPVMKAKGVNKSAMKQLTKDIYKLCLLSDNIEDKLKTTSFNRIASKEHKLMIIHQTKKSISHHDDKRYHLDAIHSISHGHWRNQV